MRSFFDIGMWMLRWRWLVLVLFLRVQGGLYCCFRCDLTVGCAAVVVARAMLVCGVGDDGNCVRLMLVFFQVRHSAVLCSSKVTNVAKIQFMELTYPLHVTPTWVLLRGILLPDWNSAMTKKLNGQDAILILHFVKVSNHHKNEVIQGPVVQEKAAPYMSNLSRINLLTRPLQNEYIPVGRTLTLIWPVWNAISLLIHGCMALTSTCYD